MSVKDFNAKPKKDIIARGQYGLSLPGTATFIGLRAVDPLVAYSVLTNGLGDSVIRKLGGSILPQGSVIIEGTGLSPYRLTLLSMSVAALLKQAFWVLAISREPFRVKSALVVGLFNNTWGLLNCVLAVTSATSLNPQFGSPFQQATFLTAGVFFVTGILLETIPEIQRNNFKNDPKNKGKVYSGGLWQYARHINYGGYAIWRTSWALACGGWTWAALTAAFFTHSFVTSSIPEIDGYCSEKYGQQWVEFKAKVPYKLFPYIY